MNRRSVLLSICLLTLGCESSPVEVQPVEVRAVGRMAIFDDVRVELTRINYSWMPTAGPLPDPSRHSMTFQVSATNLALDPRTIDDSRFRLRTWDGTKSFDQANTVVWTAISRGREPRLEGRELVNGETAQGWLTFRIPKGLSFLPDVFLWSPDPGVDFTFSFPSRSGLLCGESRIFGTVTHADGRPLVSAPLELAYFNLHLPGTSFEGGSCRGEPTSTTETRTDESGRYEDEIGSRLCDEFCVRLTVFPSDPARAVEVSGGTVVPTTPHPIVEPSELRVDAILSR